MKSQRIRIVHCADLHIGFRYKGMDQLATIRMRELLESFDRIVAFCAQTAADVLVIAGDLFDTVLVEKDFVLHVIERLQTIPDTVVAIAPGNHDPMVLDSPYREYSFPSNTIIFKEHLSCFTIEEKNLCIWGAAFGASYETESKLPTSPEHFDAGRIHIGVFHGDVVSLGQKSEYHPIRKNILESLPFDYVALGHIHKRSELMRGSQGVFAYCGSPEGHGFDELDEQGIYAGEIGKGVARVEFRRICSRCYRLLPVDISRCETRRVVSEKILQTASNAFPHEYQRDMFRIILKGELSPDFYLNVDSVKQDIAKELFYVEIQDETTRIIDWDMLALEQSLRGIFIGKMLQALRIAESEGDTEEFRKLNQAIRYGLLAFDGEVSPVVDQKDLY